MITIETICAHRIEFNYHTKSKNAIPDESEIEHVEKCLIDNCRQGDLCLNTFIKGRDYEFRGWWKIVD